MVNTELHIQTQMIPSIFIRSTFNIYFKLRIRVESLLHAKDKIGKHRTGTGRVSSVLFLIIQSVMTLTLLLQTETINSIFVVYHWYSLPIGTETFPTTSQMLRSHASRASHMSFSISVSRSCC